MRSTSSKSGSDQSQMSPHAQRSSVACNFILGLPPEVKLPKDYTRILPYFAVPALALALGTAILVGFVITTLAPLAAAVIGSALICLFWGLASRGQNLVAVGILACQFDLSVRGESTEEHLDLTRQLALFVILILKIACVAILIYRQDWQWLYLVPLASVLCAVEMSVQLGYLQCNDEDAAGARLLSILIFLGLSLVAGFKGLFVLAFVWLACYFVGAVARQRLKTHNEMINASSELAEVLVLLLGLVFMA